IGYDFDINKQWSVGASYNTGFKMPDYTALYGPWGSNPNLEPEKSKNIEARIAYTHETGSIKFVAYQNRVENLIDYISDPITWIGGYVNVGKAKMTGYTLSFDQRYDTIDLWGSADFTNPRNQQTGQRLLRRAAQVYQLGAAYNV